MRARCRRLDGNGDTLVERPPAKGCCFPFVEPVRVSVDGAQVGSLVSPGSTSFAAFNIVFSIATSGTHATMFAGTDPSNKATHIDAVRLH